MYFYSKSTGGFYIESIHGSEIPKDCVVVTKEYREKLSDMESSGMIIIPGDSGFPIAVSGAIVQYKPISITRAQGKTALIRAGLWQGVVDFVNSIEDATEKAVAEVALNDTTHWQRSSPFLNDAAQALGLTDEQLDQLFIDASKIEL